MRASLAVSNLEVRGDAADARIIGAYDYVSKSGAASRQPASFLASFRRENGSWKLTAVR
jgi:stress response protein SCP2